MESIVINNLFKIDWIMKFILLIKNSRWNFKYSLLNLVFRLKEQQKNSIVISSMVANDCAYLNLT